jgi:PKHD-type hydroxylase
MYRIRGILSDENLKKLDSLLGQGSFTDGFSTVGTPGRGIKTNLQLDMQDPNGPIANQLIQGVLTQSEEFKAYAMPLKVSDITFSRYESQMNYGDHTDNPVNWDHRQVIRSDLSFTIFLSSPDEYEGGELIASVFGSEISVKYDRGDMVIYPSGVLHRVNEITGGCRRAAVGWLQSTIRDQEQREVVRAIYQAKNEILKSSGRTPQYVKLAFAYTNLVRMWTLV